MKSINEYLNNKNNDIKVIKRNGGASKKYCIYANLSQDELDEFNKFLSDTAKNKPNIAKFLTPLIFGEIETSIYQADSFIKYFNLDSKYLHKVYNINVVKK